jgi:SAM-dependent methyltransferase
MEEHVYRQLYELEDTHWWFRGRRAVIHALLGRTPLGAQPHILDAGCGTGRNITDYSRLGDTAGVDPSPDAVAFCHARGLDQVSQSGIEELPFDDGAFDLVTATDVLEHIPTTTAPRASCGASRAPAPPAHHGPRVHVALEPARRQPPSPAPLHAAGACARC